MAEKLNLDEQQIIQLAKNGLSKAKIAEMIGCGRTTIFRTLKKHNINVKAKRPTPEERLKEKIKVNPETGCWEWQGLLNRYGYGKIKVNGRCWTTHRLSYVLNVGDIGDSMVCHRCDVRHCVNPNHLFLGSHIDNMSDMRMKSRQAKGEKHPNFKVNESTKKKMIELRSQGFNGREIAETLGIGETTVHRYIGGLFLNQVDKQKINIQKAIHLKSQGYSPKEISKELGVHIETVYRYLKSAPLIPINPSSSAAYSKTFS